MNILNLQKAFVLTCLSLSLYAATSSGKILMYVHPRSMLLVKVSCIVLFIMALNKIRLMAASSLHAESGWYVWILMLPFVITALVNPTGLSSRMAAQKGLSSMSFSYGKNSDKNSLNADSAINTDSLSGDIIDSLISRHHVAIADTVRRVSDTIIDDNMYGMLDKIYSDPGKYKDRFFTMTGFVATDNLTGPYSFFLSRMMITCCAADAMPVGFYCIAGSSNIKFKDNQWITLTGRIKLGLTKSPMDKKSRTIPVLDIINAHGTARPENEYIYQNMY
jgi:putative membrane protein